MNYLSPRIRSAVQSIDEQSLENLQEIRLRAGRPLAVSIAGREHFVTLAGRLTAYPEQAVTVLRMEVQETFRALCEYSVYSYSQELREGYITLKGGARAGIAGTAVYEDFRLKSMRDISSICLRIPRQVRNCADALIRQTVARSDGGLIVFGRAGSGKTTILRDMCRILGGRYRVSLIDTRCEIAGTLHGMPQFDVGLHTDVFDGMPRGEGAVMALRAMTPEYIVCDEISTLDEAEALMQVSGCGVRIIASAHSGSIEDAMRRKCIKLLAGAGVFEYAALLGSGTSPGVLREVVRLERSC